MATKVVRIGEDCVDTIRSYGGGSLSAGIREMKRRLEDGVDVEARREKLRAPVAAIAHTLAAAPGFVDTLGLKGGDLADVETVLTEALIANMPMKHSPRKQRARPQRPSRAKSWFERWFG